MKIKSALAALAVVLSAALPGAAQADLLFVSDAATGASNRSANSGILTRFEVAGPVHLTSIAVELDLATDGNMKFVIFNSVTGALLFDSGPKAFVDNGMGFKESDLLSFDLVSGVRYAIGILADVGSLQNFVVPGGKTMGDITSLGGNQNVSGFASPVFDGGLNGTDARVQLFGNGAAAVPEPATLLLAGLGLLAAGSARRKSAVAKA